MLGNFAIGAGLTVGILAGVAAIAVVFDKLTESTRKAKAEQDKLIAALEKSISLKGMGPGGETVGQVEGARKRAVALKNQIALLETLIVKDAQDADVIASNLIIQKKINALLIERQNALNAMAGGKGIIKEAVTEATEAAARKAEAAANKLEAAWRKAQQQAAAYLELMKRIDGRFAGTDPMTKAARKAFQLESPYEARVREYDFGRALGESIRENVSPDMPNIDFNAGLTEEQKKQRAKMGILIDDANKNADKLRDAIWGSATLFANTIVSALNVGGGGKGSNLGGALGGTAGFAAGYYFGGPIGGAIGSTIGNLTGSLLGGLFDSNKKEVNANTQALRALNQTMLLFQPGGFKVEPYRYNASDPRPLDAFGRTVRWNASRGGANPLLGT